MRVNWFMVLPALLVVGCLVLTGCGQKTSTIAPGDVPQQEEYEKEMEAEYSSTIEGAKPKEGAN